MTAALVANSLTPKSSTASIAPDAGNALKPGIVSEGTADRPDGLPLHELLADRLDQQSLVMTLIGFAQQNCRLTLRICAIVRE